MCLSEALYLISTGRRRYDLKMLWKWRNGRFWMYHLPFETRNLCLLEASSVTSLNDKLFFYLIYYDFWDEIYFWAGFYWIIMYYFTHDFQNMYLFFGRFLRKRLRQKMPSALQLRALQSPPWLLRMWSWTDRPDLQSSVPAQLLGTELRVHVPMPAGTFHRVQPEGQSQPHLILFIKSKKPIGLKKRIYWLNGTKEVK